MCVIDEIAGMGRDPVGHISDRHAVALAEEDLDGLVHGRRRCGAAMVPDQRLAIRVQTTTRIPA